MALEEIYFDRKGHPQVRSIEFQVKLHAYEFYMKQREQGKSIQDSYSRSKIYALTKFYEVAGKVAFNDRFSSEERINFLKDCMERFNQVFEFSPDRFEQVRLSKLAHRRNKQLM